MIYRHSLTLSIAVFIAFSSIAAQAQSNSGMLEHAAPALPISQEEGSLAFERDKLTFAPQSVGIENCVNIAINNTTDHPRLMTALRTLDPKHYFVTSPAAEMLPITVGANTTFYLNVCFKATEVKSYESELMAIFQGDTVHTMLSGRGVAAPEVVPIPKETAITDMKRKKHEWTFQFGLKSRGTVNLTLENMMGKVVRNFPFNEVKTPGYYETNFDEKSDAGKKLDKGSYILRLEVIDVQSKTRLHDSRLVTIK